MNINIESNTDIEEIYRFYDIAVEFQKTKFHRHWKGFDLELIEREIAEQRQWRIVIDGQTACVFAITFDDEPIWKEKNEEPSIYFHRIVTHPDYRGFHLVKHIVEWGRGYAKENNLDYLRMDTWGDNEKLIAYYQKCGFNFIGIITPDYTHLPKHYEGITLSLFEIPLN